MTKSFGLAFSDRRLRVLACRPQEERLLGKKRALEGSRKFNWRGSLRRVDVQSNRQAVAYLVVLWRQLTNACEQGGGCCPSVAELSIINL